MSIKRSCIIPSKVAEFIAKSVSLQNFDFITSDDGVITMYFNATVENIGEDYSKYDSIAVSTKTGRMTLTSFVSRDELSC